MISLAAYLIAASILLWLYFVLALRHGGGPVLAAATVGTTLLVFVAAFHFLFIGHALLCLVMLAAIAAAMTIVMFVSDENIFWS